MTQEEFNKLAIEKASKEELIELFEEVCSLVYNLGDEFRWLENLGKVVFKLEQNARIGCGCEVCENQCRLTNKDWLAMATRYRLDETFFLQMALDDKFNETWVVVDCDWEIYLPDVDAETGNLIQAPFATKQEAFVAYTQWKKGKLNER